MAVPKHILRIHDTEANLLANLKDTQIAYATDIEEAIWRNGTDFHYLASGKSWNGSAYVYSNIDAESLTIFDGTGNSKLLNYASLFTQVFEVDSASTLQDALEAEYAEKIILCVKGQSGFNFATNKEIEVYGVNHFYGADIDLSLIHI